MSESIIDRSPIFDQTAVSAETPSPDREIDYLPERRVSPAILETRIMQLKQKLQYAEIQRDREYEINRVLRERIKGHEQMAAALAERVDQAAAEFEALTGTSIEKAAGKEPAV